MMIRWKCDHGVSQFTWHEHERVCFCGRERNSPTCVYNHWIPLHYYAVKRWDIWCSVAAEAFYADWQLTIPNRCNCIANWKTETAKYPPNFTSAEAFFQWTWLVHDAVSERLGKPRISLAECYGIWMQGDSLSESEWCQFKAKHRIGKDIKSYFYKLVTDCDGERVPKWLVNLK